MREKYESLSATVLRDLAKSRGIKSTSTMKKADLVEAMLAEDAKKEKEKAAKAVGEKSIEMIHVKDITAVSGYVRGGCSPIGMKKQYPTVIQECAADFDKVYVSGGRIGTTLCMAPEDLKKVSRAEYADFIQ